VGRRRAIPALRLHVLSLRKRCDLRYGYYVSDHAGWFWGWRIHSGKYRNGQALDAGQFHSQNDSESCSVVPDTAACIVGMMMIGSRVSLVFAHPDRGRLKKFRVTASTPSCLGIAGQLFVPVLDDDKHRLGRVFVSQGCGWQYLSLRRVQRSFTAYTC
jgi:hypothetical protein